MLNLIITNRKYPVRITKKGDIITPKGSVEHYAYYIKKGYRQAFYRKG